MLKYAWVIPIVPLIAFIVILLSGKRINNKGFTVSIGAVALSFLLSILIFIEVANGKSIEINKTWLLLGRMNLGVGTLVDSLAAVMLLVVTSVSLLVQIYSVGYMHGEKRYNWYFAAISLFTAAMLSVVLANNYLQMYMSWEVMGLCSYLLIGFWFEKKSASDAAKKAFIATRIGDVGFFLGIAALIAFAGSTNFTSLSKMIEVGKLGAPILTAVGILLFAGAMGKSAQFPLHVWLPDAMEGPTPGSALIHAATMVAAGIYLVARSAFIFEAAFPSALTVVAVIGTITALMAATIAVTMSDIKKVLAYSTISQLGFMMVALGVGGVTAGIFHLVTHAFFKALLFLGAGSIIHGTGTQNMYEMGGLSKKMKTTMITFLIASLSLAGIFPLSGFWSKDEILAEAFKGGHYLIFGILLFTAFLTAFYMFRLFFLVFFGKPRNDKIRAHESPPVMSYPLIALAVPAALLGLVGSPFLGNAFSSFFAAHG
ncbi:MAG: NADH-quinone oxidoreductase subunit L, partial [Actinomycetota bacterium]